MVVEQQAVDQFREALLENSSTYRVKLNDQDLTRLTVYYTLLKTWNPRLHLVAPCSPEELATRHVLESLLLLPYLKYNARIADIGSGAGLPIIPNLILRSDITAFLIESSKRKSVFLREVLRKTGLIDQSEVIAERFEAIETPAVEYVTCRALEEFSTNVPKIVSWAPVASTLLLFAGSEVEAALDQARAEFSKVLIPNSIKRFLLVATLSPP